jgi:hypothetical protein
LLYCLGSEGIADTKLGGQHLLLVHQPRDSCSRGDGPSVQLEVLSAANGQVSRSLRGSKDSVLALSRPHSATWV